MSKGQILVTKTQRKEVIAKKFSDIIEALGLDLKDGSLSGTPERVARMFVDEIFEGLFSEPPKLTNFEAPTNYDQMILVKDIQLYSTCEHHFVPFIGVAHVAYIPNKRVVGISKINRTVRYFASRPQIQERIGKQVIEYLMEGLDTEDMIVVTDCKHLCTCVRGVKDPTSQTVCVAVSGAFKNEHSIKTEFYNLIKA